MAYWPPIITMKFPITSISKSPDGLTGYRKSPIIWGNRHPNTGYPLAYLRKPAWMTDEDWRVVFNGLQVTLPKGFKFTVKD